MHIHGQSNAQLEILLTSTCFPLSRIRASLATMYMLSEKRGWAGKFYVSEIMMVMMTGAHTAEHSIGGKELPLLGFLSSPPTTLWGRHRNFIPKLHRRKQGLWGFSVTCPKLSFISWARVPQEDLQWTRGIEPMSSSVINPSKVWPARWLTEERERCRETWAQPTSLLRS